MAIPSLMQPARPAPGLTVRLVDPRVDRDWLAYVEAHPEALVYHHPAWQRVLARAYGHRPLGVVCEEPGGRLRGVLPLSATHGLLTGRRLSSLPHTPLAGPLADDRAALGALLQAALELVRRRPGTQLQLKVLGNNLAGLAPGLVGAPWEATYRLTLPARAEELRIGSSRNHSRIRWAANKAARNGVVVRPAETVADLRTWYQLYLETMRWHAVPPRPYHFFLAAWAELRPLGMLRLLLAEQQAEGQARLLAGSVFLRFGQTTFYAFNGRRREELALRPNDVIQWQAIQDACHEGDRVYDFGEVDEANQGLAEFKSKWGADAQRLYRFYYPAPRELETGPLASSSPARRLAEQVWRRVPLSATAGLSRLIYRYV